ncbi:MAG: prolipoprotein diacylglyceryl transferase [Candidatus Dormibacteraceae bacterium]
MTGSLPLVIDFPFSPILIQLGPLAIRWYGVCYAIAFIVGVWVAGRHARARGFGDAELGNMAFWSIVIGLIAARLYYVVQSGLGWYLTHPLHILAVWEGGMAYYGAVIAVPIFLVLYCIRKRMDWWVILDAAAFFAAVGQPIGRVGNIFNGESDLLGPRSNLPWAFAYTNPDTMAPQLGVGYQPAGLYELVLALIILGVLLLLRSRLRLRAGALFLIYLFLYALSQFGIFFLRDNSVTLWGLKQAQLTSLALLLVAVILTVVWFRLGPRQGGTPASEPAGAEAGSQDPGGEVLAGNDRVDR